MIPACNELTISLMPFEITYFTRDLDHLVAVFKEQDILEVIIEINIFIFNYYFLPLLSEELQNKSRNRSPNVRLETCK